MMAHDIMDMKGTVFRQEVLVRDNIANEISPLTFNLSVFFTFVGLLRLILKTINFQLFQATKIVLSRKFVSYVLSCFYEKHKGAINKKHYPP